MEGDVELLRPAVNTPGYHEDVLLTCSGFASHNDL